MLPAASRLVFDARSFARRRMAGERTVADGESRKTEKDLMWENGGPGVYSCDYRKYYDLKVRRETDLERVCSIPFCFVLFGLRGKFSALMFLSSCPDWSMFFFLPYSNISVYVLLLVSVSV